ncbi:extracellular solute-binding protein [Chloroflexi bacterium TSY]|nr:extracellular solute-binding protein [Chloroflexi bacterium TSY]
MTTENLTMWVLDLGLPEALTEFPVGPVQPYDWNWTKFHTDLLRSVHEGTAPDLVNIGTTYTGRLIQDGVLLNITDFATEHLDICGSCFPRTLYSCQDAFQINHYYAVPLLADVRVLFYNVEYVKEYLDNHPNAFKNWNAFEAMCLALKEKFPNRVMAWPLDLNAFHDLLPWVWAAGGGFVSLSNQMLLESEYTRNAIYRLARLILTDCAPIPPSPSFQPDRIRTQLEIGNIAITSGTLWLDHTPRWQTKFKAVLHPSDAFSATFIGGSNLAIVRKHGDDEHDEAYRPAKELLASLVSTDSQLKVAKSTGKLPCYISAWNQMRRTAPDAETKELLETFNRALCYTVERSMPPLPNFAQIEEELKISISKIWEEVGKIKITHPNASLEILEAKCKSVIDDILSETKQNIEKFVTGFVVQYRPDEVEEIGIKRPEQQETGLEVLSEFDLWLKVTQNDPIQGIVYIARRGAISKGIGPKPFQMLLALVNAPQRTLSQDDLLRIVWGIKETSTNQRLDNIAPLAQQLPILAEMLKSPSDLEPRQLTENLRRNSTQLPYLEIVRRLQQRNKWPVSQINDFQAVVSGLIKEYSEIIEDNSSDPDRKRSLDTLRNTYNTLRRNLGQIRENQIIKRLKQDTGFVYCLDSNISICLERT